MNHSPEWDSLTAELVEAGRRVDERGWVPATSGNFSARLADGTLAITVSGCHKGRMSPGDIMPVDAAGHSLDGRRPSAETGLHTSLYRLKPNTGAVFHTHSPGAVMASRLFPEGLVLQGHELLKALEGVATHEASVPVPVFANDQDIPALASRVEDYLARHADCPAYIIAGHGFYTWAATVRDALRQVEALEFLFEIECRLFGLLHGANRP